MASRLGQKVLSLAAGIIIVILVVLIVLLWTVFGYASRDLPPALSVSTSSNQSEHSEHQRNITSGIAAERKSIHLKASKLPSKAGDLRKTPQNVEYVKPMKISPPPLHEDDLLYGGDEWGWDMARASEQPPLHVETGHFRNKTAPLWDPHPQYRFRAFGHLFHLLLVQDSSFVSPSLQVTHMWHNYSNKESRPMYTRGCYYTGKVQGEPNSSVAVSLCHGMTGHIRTSNGNYFIEPTETWPDQNKSILHAVYAVPVRGLTTNNDADDDDYDIHRCGLVGENTSPPKDGGSKRTRRSVGRRIRRPSRREYFVEVMVVADKKMAAYHGASLNDYILTLLSIVAKLYKDSSIGNPVSVAVVNLVVLSDMEFVLRDGSRTHEGTSATEMMRQFCKWQKDTNIYDDTHPAHHDTALLLTRENICRDPNGQKCETLGLAELGTMCDRNSSCAIVQDNGLSAAFTIAHEFGHVLNMPHDDAEDCRPYRSPNVMHNVMSRMLDGTTSPWSWSNCSRHFLTEFLDAGRGSCLMDSPSINYITNISADTQPGENFTVDRQCEFVFGPGSRICSYMPMCERLWCTTGRSEDEGPCRTKHMPWADGTACGRQMWCQRGACVPRDRGALMPVNGGWGSWQRYGECSRTCGGGVKRAFRECNNPPPSNGGRYCIGRRMKFQSCATKDCPKGSRDFREEQCAVFNNHTFGFRGLPKDVKWVPKYGTAPDERCRLYCRVMQSSSYYRLKEKVIDGTTCGPDTFEICVNGICRPAGCNHELGSHAKLDVCGQCNGNNSSCKVEVGTFNQSSHGYNNVVTIPSGSMDIDVRQTAYDGSTNDGNFLAVKDGETGEYILNGGYVLTMFRKVMSIAGTKLEYTGSNTIVERINASKPLKKDLQIQILSVGHLFPPNISWKYIIHRCHWELAEQWSKCDKVCHGRSYRKKYICVRADKSEKVAESLCRDQEKPDVIIKWCNTHCTLRWKVVTKTECSNSCGRGRRNVSVQCVQEFGNHQSRAVPSSECAHLSDRPQSFEDCETQCGATHWKFGEWGICSKTCGVGFKHRLAECVNEYERPINESLCASTERVTQRPCGIPTCPKWQLGEWTPCSVSCGVGERYRPYWCHLDKHIVSPSFCSLESIPPYRERCLSGYCNILSSGSWQQM